MPDTDDERIGRSPNAYSSSEAETNSSDSTKSSPWFWFEASEERSAIKASTPLSILRELVAANDLKKDIVRYIGSKGITREVLSGKREISKATAHKLGLTYDG